MKKLYVLCIVLMLSAVSAAVLAEGTTVLSFSAKKGDVNGGFVAQVAVSAAPAPQSQRT